MTKVDALLKCYPVSAFGGFSDVDGTVAFYNRVQALLGLGAVVLDVGCGRGAALVDDPVTYRRKLRDFRAKGARVIGLDVDKGAAENPGLDEFHLLSSKGRWPISDSSVDVIVSDFVLEHIDEPSEYFAEVRRVLRPGGVFCARTTNRLGYVGIAASLIPNRLHEQVVGYVQDGRESVDVFPTRYRVNTVWALRSHLRIAKLEGVVYGFEAEPSYLAFSLPLYALGKAVHALTPSMLRTCLFVFARKPAN